MLKKIFNQLNNSVKTKGSLKNCTNYLKNFNYHQLTTNELSNIKFNNNCYQRNLVYQTDDLECLLLCWKPNQSTPYHYHPSQGCIYKILQGNMMEYIKSVDNQIYFQQLNENKIGYIDDTIGTHKMVNGDKNCISLHFYSPPNFYK